MTTRSEIPTDHRPKVVFVNRFFHPDQSATSQLLSDLAFGLAKSGRRIHVVCSRQRYDDARANLTRSESVAGVSVHRLWTTRFGRGRLLGRALDYGTFYLSSAVTLLRILERGDTVVAETDPPLISIVAMAAARVKGAHLINWLQDIFPEVASWLGANPLPRQLDAVLRHTRDGSLRAARVNVVLGERMRECLLRLGVPGDRIRIIQNWAEVGPSPPKAAEESRLRREIGLSGKFVVGYSGNLGRAHEFQTLLAAAVILKDDSDIVFLMIGAGAGMAQLKQAVAERALNNFHFLPYQPRESLADSLAASDLHWVSLNPAMEGLIVPSKFYGILAAARPVIFVGDTDGELARVIRSNQCGSAVTVGDSRAVAETVRAFKADPAYRSSVGARGHQLYRDQYSAQRALAQWTQILQP